jgi:hypothetical protein
MCDIPFDRRILQLSNGIRHVMSSTEKMLELTAKHRWLSRLTAGCVFQWVKHLPSFIFYLAGGKTFHSTFVHRPVTI